MKKRIVSFLLIFVLLVSLVPQLPEKAAAAESKSRGSVDITKLNLNNWMYYLSDNIPINQINLPGTHDSGTAFPTIWETTPFASAQDDTIPEQLENGIRVLDIRLNVLDCTDNMTWRDLAIYHGPFSMRKYEYLTIPFLYFEDVLEWVQEFLARNDSEVVIIKLQEEDGPGSFANKESLRLLSEFSQEVKAKKIPNAVYYYQGEEIPKLGDVRGKIVFIDNESYSISISDTEKKDSGKTYTKFEDHCDILPSDKLKWVRDTFEHVKTYQSVLSTHETFGKDPDNDDTWDEPRVKLVHTSSNSFPNPLGAPALVANKVNPWFEKYQFVQGYRYGWIMMDFPTEKMVRKVIESNIFPEKADVKINVVWTGKSDFDPTVMKFHLEAEHRLNNQPYTKVKTEDSDITWEGNTLIFSNVDYYERLDTNYKVIVDYAPEGCRCKVKEISPKEFTVTVEPPTRTVEVTLKWDCVPYHPVKALWPLKINLTKSDGSKYTVRTDGIRRQSSATETVVTGFFTDELTPMEYTVDLNPSCLSSDYTYDPATDIVKTGNYTWTITLHTTRAKKELTGSIRFVDNNNENGLRPDQNSAFWKDLLAVGVYDGIPTSDTSSLQLDFSKLNEQGIVSVDAGKVPVTSSFDSTNLDWTLQIPDIKGYDISVDGMNVVLTYAKYQQVQINWVGDTEDVRPSTLKVQLLRGNLSEGLPYTEIATRDAGKRTNSWMVYFSPQETYCIAGHIPDDITVAVKDVPLGYTASAPYANETGDGYIIDMVYSPVTLTQIAGDVNWIYPSTRTVPKLSLVLYRNGESYKEISLTTKVRNYSFAELESKDASGEPYLYSVSVVCETENAEYKALMDGNNVYIYPVTEFSGEVKWITEKTFIAIDRPAWITEHPQVTLLMSTNGTDYVPMDVQPKWNGEHFVFTDIPFVVFKNGLPTRTIIYYAVTQADVSGFTTTAYAPSAPDDGVWSKDINNTLNSEVTVTVPYQIKLSAGTVHDAKTFDVELVDSDNRVVATGSTTLEKGVMESDIQELTFTVDRPGELTYTLRQKHDTDADWQYGADKELKISIGWDADAALLTAQMPETCVLSNSFNYDATPAECDITVVLDLQNTSGEPLPENETFKFEITGDDNRTIEITNYIQSSIHLTFDKIGVYKYTVSQSASAKNGWTTDSSTYSLEITVKEDGKGGLTANCNRTPEFIFSNSYSGNRVTYSVAVITSDETMGVAYAELSVSEAGETISLIAYAFEGYHFAGWDSSDVDASSGTFTMPSKDVTITALFEADSSDSSKSPLGSATPLGHGTPSSSTTPGGNDTPGQQGGNTDIKDPNHARNSATWALLGSIITIGVVALTGLTVYLVKKKKNKKSSK